MRVADLTTRPNRKRTSSRSAKRRLTLIQGTRLNFERLEDRNLLAAITVSNATDLVSPTADTSSITALVANDGGDGISLREAIAATNNTTGDDTITFDGSVFTGGTNSLIRLTQGQLQVTETLTIDASMATDVTITGDANGDDITLPGTFITDVGSSVGELPGGLDDLLDDNSRVINSFGSQLTLSNVTLTGGRTTDFLSPGGAINAESLTLTNSTVSGNSTSGDRSEGGAIYADGLTLTNSTVSGNSTSGDRSDGGGISVSSFTSAYAESSIIDSIVGENSTTGSGSRGGGISVVSSDLSLVNSLVSGNNARAEGGGISIDGEVTLTSSEVSGNSSYAGGGGIHADGSNGFFFGSVLLTDSTISNNRAIGYSSPGGGIWANSVQLVRSTVSGNSASGDRSSGGGIYVASSFGSGSVTAVDSTVSENSSSGFLASGGGIFANLDVRVSLNGSLVSGNSTSGEGGGIRAGFIELISSTVAGNSTSGTSGTPGNGGGVSASNVTLISSTVSGNSATGDRSSGGGVDATSVVLRNSTVSGNDATVDGGGVFADQVSLTNSTITDNSAGGEGGGIFVDDTAIAPDFNSANSIIAGNTDSGIAPDVGGNLQDLVPFDFVEHTLIGDTTGSGLTLLTDSGNIFDQPALLGPLTDHGGSTLTHALLPGSPAIDSGSDALAIDANQLTLTTDQRGAPFTRIFAGAVDIGSFEVQPPASLAPTVVSVAINEGGVLARPDLWNTLTVVFDSEVTVAATDLALFNDSTLSSRVDLSGISFSFDPPSNTATWDFSTLASPLDAGFYTYQLDASSISFEGLSLDGNGDDVFGDDFIARHYVAIPGDANLDGVVDVLNDGFALVANLNSANNFGWSNGDFNNDGVVDVLGDGFVLVGNLGQDVRVSSDLVVSNTTDIVNGDTESIVSLLADDGGDGISLREAIAATNNSPGEDTITFDGRVFTGGANSLVRLTQGQLEINDSLTINASTGTNVTISGDADGNDSTVLGTYITDVAGSYVGGIDDRLADNSRVFLSLGSDLILANLTVTGGRTESIFSGQFDLESEGGGIYAVGGSLSLIRSTVSGNSTGGGSADGGGVSAEGASVMVVDSVISNNSVTGLRSDGGGLYSYGGVVSLIRSTISGNSTDGLFSGGGGIAVNEGELTLTDSTVNGNNTLGDASAGGAIFSRSGASVSLTNSTIHGNHVTGDRSNGGGLSVLGPITLVNSTVSGNSTKGDAGDGGGIAIREDQRVVILSSIVTENSAAGYGNGLHFRNENSTGDTEIFNSIIAGNNSRFFIDSGLFIFPGPDLFIPGDFEGRLDHSLVGDTTGTGITASTGVGNILEQPALLGPLADNGGLTLTHALLAGSPAIDAGSNTLAVDADGVPLATDQRGDGFDRIKFGRIDIGAFESDFDAPPIAPSVLSVTIDEGGVLAQPDLWNTLTIVFDADVTVDSGDLSLVNDSTGGVTVDLTGIGFSYDSITGTATWDFGSLANPLDAAFYTYQLDASSITFEGLSLDGNGDGTGGDDFIDQHYVALPGDANQDGVVDVLNDAFALVANLGSTTNLAWADGNFNGDEQVNVLGDAFVLVANLGRDVRPAVALFASSSAGSDSASLTLGSSSAADEQDELTDGAKSLVQSPSLVLASDHELRDDVFGSDF